MTLVDYGVLGIVGFSILMSISRGAVREVMALLSWIVAFGVAMLYTGSVAPLLPDSVSNPAMRGVVGFLALFVVTLIVMSMVGASISRLVKSVGLGPVDRSLGAVFGLARGLLIVVTLALLAGLTSLPREPVWTNAVLHEPLESVAARVQDWLPADVARRIRFR